MSKSGQPATKADTGGQRVPKTEGESAGNDKKTEKVRSPAKKVAGKKPAP